MHTRTALKSVLMLLAVWGIGASAALVLGRGFSKDVLYFIASLDGRFKVYTMDISRSLTHKLNDQEARADQIMLSPRGQHILFIARTGNLTYAPYLMDWNGANLRPLPVADARQINWSPDGDYLAYWSAYDQHIYVMDTAGDSQQLTRGFTDQRSPIWSPDGKSIAYVSTRGGWTGLYVMDADGTHARCLTNHPVYINGLGTLGWSPDGKQLAAVGDYQGRLTIFVTRPDEINSDEFCSGREQWVDLGNANIYSLAWSPDGRQILYTSNSGGDWAIYAIDASCLGINGLCLDSQRRLSPFRANASQHAWSPDGQYVAYTVGLNRSPQLWVASIDGEQRQISDRRYSYWSPVWWAG
jgi:TolB protein